MAPKRPHDAASSSEDGAKRPRTSNEGTGAPGSAVQAAAAAPAPHRVSIQDQIAAAKARAAQLMKERGANGAGNGGVMGAAVPQSAAARPPTMPARPATTTNTGAGARYDPASIQRQIAEARKRADEKLKAQRSDDAKPSGIHPLLMGNNAGSASNAPPGPSANRHVAPKFSTLSANARLSAAQSRPSPSVPADKEAVTNPYLQASAEEDDEDAARARSRTMHKGLVFNAPGRHIRAAEEARHEAKMEALKRRIEESARKAGMSELTAEERALRRPQPPDVEWWDQAFLPGNSYDAITALEKGKAKQLNAGDVRIEGEGSPIDIYIQHPIPIPAPSDKIKVQPRGVMLTKKEQKKMRKMRREAEREDKQDKIKMGLLPPDPPKVKLSNLMRVLASESVADPTKIEARVRREVAARKEQHEQTNLERMLTPEQRREKAQAAKEQDLSKGTYTLVFKVRHLVSPSHKFKVRKNALQYGLTGMTVFGPNFALVVVEGGQKAIKAYRRLMTVRIDWSDPKRPRAEADDDFADGSVTPGPSEGSRFGSAGPSAATTSNLAEQEAIAQIDWTENYCHLIFEGPLRQRNFGYGFKARTCETDGDAKEALGPKLASFWDLAKREERAVEEEDAL